MAHYEELYWLYLLMAVVASATAGCVIAIVRHRRAKLLEDSSFVEESKYAFLWFMLMPSALLALLFSFDQCTKAVMVLVTVQEHRYPGYLLSAWSFPAAMSVILIVPGIPALSAYVNTMGWLQRRDQIN